VRVGRQFASFACGVAVGVCLLLLPKLWRQIRESPSQTSPGAIAAQARTSPAPLVGQDQHHARVHGPLRASSSEPSHARARMVGERRPAPHVTPHAALHPEAVEAEEVAINPGGRESGQAEPSAVAPAASASASFKPLGYVEKTEGRIEAIVSQGDQVYVVHEGELFAGKYRVLKISPDLVEAVDETTVRAAQPPAPQAPCEAASKQPTSRVSSKLSASAPENPRIGDKVNRSQSHDASLAAIQTEQISTDHVTMSVAEPLGYVERADGRVETVVADGEHVRLVQQAPLAALARNTSPTTNSTSTIKAAAGKIGQAGVSPAQVAEASALPDGGSAGGPAMAIRAVSFTPRPPVRLRAAKQGKSPIPANAEERSSNAAPRDVAGHAVGGSTGAIRPVEFLVSGPTARPGVPVGRPISMKTIGFVEKAGGQLYAIVPLGDDVYVVQQGGFFAGRYHALRVSREFVEAAEEAPHDGLSPPVAQPPPLPGLFSFKIRDGRSPPLPEGIRPASRPGRAANPGEVTPTDGPVWASLPPSARQDRRARRRALKSPSRDRAGPTDKAPVWAQADTFVFQTLGYVTTTKGALEAIVADGARVYLVGQGELFADHYRAVSVDPAVVLAVRAPPGQDGTNSLSCSTDPGAPASKKVAGVLCLLPSETAYPGPLRDTGVFGATHFTGVDSNLLGSLAFAGFDLQSPLGMADNRSDAY
jgi:hypothetical protein